MYAEVMARRMSVNLVRASQDPRASVTSRSAKESLMSYPDAPYRGAEGESRVRYRAGAFRRIPLAPHQMQERCTPTPDVFVLCHLGVPLLAADTWSLMVDGLVARPLCLSFSDLTAYPRCTITSFHQCVGNPLQPREPTRRIANVRWRGARLSDILRDCRPAPEAHYLWSYGADYGEFGGMDHQAYVKDVPLARVPSDVVIAYELNGAPLPAEHGFPAHLVVPGFYGTNSVKWLTRMTVAAARAPGPFTTRWYTAPVPDTTGGDTGKRVPVWSVAPESVIVSPAPGQALQRDTLHEVWGWAWADQGIDRVEVSVDGGATWREVQVEPREERAWQRFVLSWRATDPGAVVLCSKAYAHDGTRQPECGHRNAIHRIEVHVV
jgi:DMSO/TMAO reductase YedYZ molybdopterin-dependent catalytic subunit